MTAGGLLLGIVALSAVLVLGTVIVAVVYDSMRPAPAAGASLTPASESEAQRQRRVRDAKQINEQLKLFAAFLNGLGIAFLVAVAIVPMAAPDATFSWQRALVALAVALVLHTWGQLALTAWKSEA